MKSRKNRSFSRSRNGSKKSGSPKGPPAKALPPMEGNLKTHREGYGFVLNETPGGLDVFVPARRMHGAMNGDRVRVKVEVSPRDGRLEGEILEVVKRGTQFLVGTLKKIRKSIYAEVAQNARVMEFVIDPDALGGAEVGQSVGIKILKYPEGFEQGQAEVVKVFAQRGEEKNELEVLILEHQLPTQFNEEAVREARAIQENPGIGLSEGREDLRHLPFVTIDGENARDFDDAIYVKKETNGWRLWVSIADVSHYVTPGTALDRDAFSRGTSVYFPDLCLPMLPEELSNDVCSLRPNEDRMAFTCEMQFNSQGVPKGARCYLSLIRSHARLTYKQVARALIDGDAEVQASMGNLLPVVEQALEFARILRTLRFGRGSIDFDLPEPEVVLNLEEGITEKIIKAERSESHFMIEEFMIAANEAVARTITERKWPGIYRIHEQPDPAKVENFHVLLHNLGFDFAFPKEPTPKFFNHILQKVKGHSEVALIQHMLLRTMRQAIYSTENRGHFGLASTCYTHFTSPIRRYPDLEVHRTLRKLLITSRAPTGKHHDQMADQLAIVAGHCSSRERTAMEAEWEAIDLKVALFMERFVGREFEGFVSRIAKFGFFVELKDYFVEGLVRLEELKDDYYLFDEKKHRLRGRKGGKVFKIGSEVKVRVNRVSIPEREVYLELIG